MIARLRRWFDVALLLWQVHVMREYLQAIVQVSDCKHARILAQAALIESAARTETPISVQVNA